MKKANVLFLLDNSYTTDRRVIREAETLVENGYNVTLLAVKSTDLPVKEVRNGVQVIRLFDRTIFDIKNRKAIPNAISNIIDLNLDFDVIHAHDQTMLAIGVGIKKRFPEKILIYDSHELFSSWPLNVSNHNSFSIFIKSYIVRKFEIFREKRNAKYIDYLITVNDSLNQYLTKYFKIKTKSLSLRNIPEGVQTDLVKTNILRDKFQIDTSKKILVFIGSNIHAKTLNLEQVIEEVSHQNGIALVFIGSLNEKSKPLQDIVKGNQIQNVYFHDRIVHDDIPQYLSSADVGLVPTWNKKDLSYWYALDNKLFEYMRSEIPILATQQPEYKEIVEKYGVGICINPDKKNAYIDGFREIIEKYDTFIPKLQKAKEELSWENEQKKLIEFYQEILK